MEMERQRLFLQLLLYLLEKTQMEIETSFVTIHTTYLVMNQTIYSERKMKRMVDVFSGLVDTILKTENPDQIMISESMV